ncbi:MAG: 50S ribosomal protein L23 [Myxococcales bacterium]|nr:50S ribosomal protein L23 [Myxococcales bacterium]
MRSPHQVLIKPRITEKGSQGPSDRTVAVFEVPLDAGKDEIRQAVQNAFNVEVDDVRTMVVRGKIKRRGRHVGRRSNWKKAIVTLSEGHSIDFFGTAS